MIWGPTARLQPQACLSTVMETAMHNRNRGIENCQYCSQEQGQSRQEPLKLLCELRAIYLEQAADPPACFSIPQASTRLSWGLLVTCSQHLAMRPSRGAAAFCMCKTCRLITVSHASWMFRIVLHTGRSLQTSRIVASHEVTLRVAGGRLMQYQQDLRQAWRAIAIG